VRGGAQYAARGKLSRALADVTGCPHPRHVGGLAVWRFGAQVAAERVTHTEVVTLLRSGVALDFVIDLHGSAAATSQSNESTAEPGQPAPAGHHEPAYWVRDHRREEVAAPEQAVAAVVASAACMGDRPGRQTAGSQGSPRRTGSVSSCPARASSDTRRLASLIGGQRQGGPPRQTLQQRSTG